MADAIDGDPAPRLEDSTDADPTPPSSGHNETSPTIPVLKLPIRSLFASTLPDSYEIQLRIVATFFARVQHHYGLSFIHCPGFTAAFNEGKHCLEFGEPLVRAMFALTARTIFLEEYPKHERDEASLGGQAPGSAWAEIAKEQVMRNLGALSLRDLMAIALLCAYELQKEEYGGAYMLAAVLHRGIELLGLDRKRPCLDDGPGNKCEIILDEMENRLVWASFVLDALVSNCRQKHMCWKTDMPQIPFPCRAEAFLDGRRTAPIFFHQVDQRGILSTIADFDFNVLNILVLYFRSWVIGFVYSDDLGEDAWRPAGKFLMTKVLLQQVLQLMPQTFALDGDLHRLYDMGMLGPTLTLHLRIHLSLMDLAKISIPLCKLPLAPAFQQAPDAIQLAMLDLCKAEAKEITSILRKGFRWGEKMGWDEPSTCAMFDDPMCVRALVESTKVHILHGATFPQSQESRDDTTMDIRISLLFLDNFERIDQKMRNLMVRELLLMCHLFGYTEVVDFWSDIMYDATSEESVGFPTRSLDKREEIGSRLPAGLTDEEMQEAIEAELISLQEAERNSVTQRQETALLVEAERAVSEHSEDEDIDMDE